MRAATRLLASVKPARFLEAGNPTGLTGLVTHAAPRSTLLFLYEATLDRLQSFPEHSVYRQSTEAITKHRRGVVSSVKAAGYEEWSQRILKIIEKHPNAFSSKQNSPYFLVNVGNSAFVSVEQKPEDGQLMEWDGEHPDGLRRKYNVPQRVARVGNRVATVEKKPEDERPVKQDVENVTEGVRENPQTTEEWAKIKRTAEEWANKLKPPKSSQVDLDALWEPEPPLEASQYVGSKTLPFKGGAEKLTASAPPFPPPQRCKKADGPWNAGS